MQFCQNGCFAHICTNLHAIWYALLLRRCKILQKLSILVVICEKLTAAQTNPAVHLVQNYFFFRLVSGRSELFSDRFFRSQLKML